jgi:hypothetical protein
MIALRNLFAFLERGINRFFFGLIFLYIIFNKIVQVQLNLQEHLDGQIQNNKIF